MKKLVLLSLSIAIGLSSFAQKQYVKASKDLLNKSVEATRVKVNFKEKAVEPMEFSIPQTMSPSTKSPSEYEEWNTMLSVYDLQSNAGLGNRMYE